ncbi:hypothetical protein BAV89_002464 [Escherichia coli]|uniref:hypothetical protein n=1 Tax=Escherichia coli TaxID=562 RepID=UPI0010F0E4BF|nr:hypothetical protein [Escherichia coli]EFA0749647.1 hypothetical protein [Escherichia coli]EFB5911438.1 hypothetical protein [Escherichia coli]EFC7392274.1 hypothetical protein [Escherichia coli]EFC7397062.1 hypothetical protein [Escherichia coli]EFC7416927.1 hypothetical protein [Escherichia coli]
MRNLGSNTYLDLMAQRTPSIEGADEREAFSRLLQEAAKEIAARVPELVMPLIDERVEELFQAMPESMKKEDKVTHDKMDAKAFRNMFAGMVANRLGLGFSALRK